MSGKIATDHRFCHTAHNLSHPSGQNKNVLPRARHPSPTPMDASAPSPLSYPSILLISLYPLKDDVSFSKRVYHTRAPLSRGKSHFFAFFLFLNIYIALAREKMRARAQAYAHARAIKKRRTSLRRQIPQDAPHTSRYVEGACGALGCPNGRQMAGRSVVLPPDRRTSVR